MKCPECGREFNVETRYNPSTRKNDMPFITYMHSYDFGELIMDDFAEICKHSVQVVNK